MSLFAGRTTYVSTGIKELKAIKSTPMEFDGKLAFSTDFEDRDGAKLNCLIFDNFYSKELMDELSKRDFVELKVSKNDRGYLQVELINDLV